LPSGQSLSLPHSQSFLLLSLGVSCRDFLFLFAGFENPFLEGVGGMQLTSRPVKAYCKYCSSSSDMLVLLIGIFLL
jgi:hypothetical protein